MNFRFAFFTVGVLLSSAALSAATSKPISDLVSPEKRRAVVDLALRLSRVPEPVALPPDLAQPFSPTNFEQPDPEEIRAAATARANSSGGSPGGVVGPGGAVGPVAGAQAPRPPADREILESIAPKILPTGTIKVGGEPLLIFGRKLPDLGRGMGQSIREFKKGLKDVEEDVKRDEGASRKALPGDQVMGAPEGTQSRSEQR